MKLTRKEDEMNHADCLRELAAWLDERPNLLKRASDWGAPSIGIYLYDADGTNTDVKESFSQMVREMGSSKKSGHDGTITARHAHENSNGKRIFTVSVSLAGACEKRPAMNEDGTPKVRKASKYVETDEVEPVYEWTCPESFLNL